MRRLAQQAGVGRSRKEALCIAERTWHLEAWKEGLET